MADAKLPKINGLGKNDHYNNNGRVRPDLIASRFEGLTTGPRFLYSFEDQNTYPIDGTNPLMRQLSPFTLSILPPQLIADSLESSSSFDVNRLAKASSSTLVNKYRADQYRKSFGTGSILGSSSTARIDRLQQIVSAGQVFSGLTSNIERAVIVDQYTAADVALQVEQILNFPPLTLLINPRNLSLNYNNIQKFSDRTRTGFIFERWGGEQVDLSFSGSCAGFITAHLPAISGNTSPVFSGNGMEAKRNSAGFQNFLALYHFYRNNGIIHDNIKGTEAHHMVGAIAINYDQKTYIGHIESFDYAFSEELVGRLDYNLAFKADYIFDNAQPTSVVTPPRPLGNTDLTTFSGDMSGRNSRDKNSVIDPFSEEGQDRLSVDFASIPFELLVNGGR